METIRLGFMTISAVCMMSGFYVDDPDTQRIMGIAFIPGIAMFVINNDRQ